MVVDPVPTERRRAVEMVASSALANARTAAEYVSRALEMQGKHRTPPHSNYVKYDVYTNQETKSLQPNNDDYDDDDQVNQIEIPVKSYPAVPRSSSDFDYQHRNYGVRKPPVVTTSAPEQRMHKKVEADNIPYVVVEPPYGSTNADIPKSEIIKHIQTSVMRYMKELEAEGRLPSSSVGIASTERPRTEIKTYYRILPVATASDEYNKIEKVKDDYSAVAAATHSEFFKPNSAKAPQSYQTFKSTTQSTKEIFHPAATTQSTPNIDLTFRSRGRRPKPSIDLAALDVGQSWSHHDTTEHRKPKLHFNSDAYHEINSMTYGGGGKTNLNSGEEAPDNVATYGDSSAYGSSSQVTPVKFKDGDTKHVQSTIAVDSMGSDQNVEPSISADEHYRGPIHVINGIPVTNPYKFNMDQLK